MVGSSDGGEFDVEGVEGGRGYILICIFEFCFFFSGNLDKMCKEFLRL